MPRRRPAAFVCASCAAAIAALALSSAAVADPVSIEAIHDSGIERLRMTWPAPVRFSAAAAEGLLTLTFERPVDADLRPLAALPLLSAPARLSDDRRALLLPLAPNASALTYADGRIVFVDLLPVSSASTPAPAPAPAPVAAPAEPSPAQAAPVAAKAPPENAVAAKAPPENAVAAKAPPENAEAAKAPPETAAAATAAPGEAAATPTVRVRYGNHGTWARVVFDWPIAVGYRIERAGDQTTVTFDHQARLDTARAGRRPKQIRDLRVDPGAGDVAVTLTTATGEQMVRDFRLGSRVVVDVLTPSASGEAVSAGQRLTPPSPPMATAQATQEVEDMGADGQAAFPATGVPPLPRSRPVTVAADETGDAAAPPVAESDHPAPQPAAQPAAVAAAPPAPSAESSAAAPPAPSAESSAATPPETAAETASADHPAAGELRFDWQQPVAAAVFRRDGHLWVVFDAPSKRDLAALTAASGGTITDAQQLAVAGATVLRLVVTRTTAPRLRRSGHAWIVSFDGPPPEPPPDPLVPTPEPQAVGGPRLVVPVAAPGRPIVVGDPDIGDTLIIVPTVPLGRGLNRAYSYPMFELLPTDQGVVIAPLIDTLSVDADGTGIAVSSRAGLILSALPERIRAGTRLAPPADVKPTTDLKRWADASPTEFIARRQALTRQAGLASGASRTRARLALAEFYLAYGLAAEALGELTVAADEDKDAAATPEMRLLTGAAQLIHGRVEDARRTLAEPVLNGLDEAALWRTAVDAAAGKAEAGPGASPVPFDREAAILLGYPRPLRLVLAPLLVDAALASGRLQVAQDLLATARADAPSAAAAAVLDELDGRIRLASGDRPGARAAFARAAAGPSAKAQALGGADLVELGMKDGTLQPKEALARLERLRFVWRGDAFEAKLLLRLSQLAADVGEYARALRTLRQLTSHFRGRPEAATAAERMASLFQTLYLDGAADKLPPITAVALYNEFRELTPPGAKGRRIVLGLAGRLMALELPGSAATLLEPALTADTDAGGRAELGTALARAQDQAGNPQGVLSALARSSADTIAEPMATARRCLEAKALIDLGRQPQALAVLAQIGGEQAANLRTELHRREGDWAAASLALGRQVAALTGGSGTPGGTAQRSGQEPAAVPAATAPPPPATGAAPPATGATPPAEDEAATQLLSGMPLGATPDRATIDRAVDQAVRFRDAMDAAEHHGPPGIGTQMP